MHLCRKGGASPMILFVALKSSSPSPRLSTEHTRPCSPHRSLPVLLLLSEQPNEAEGQRSARAILLHYARIHSLSHKQSGQAALENKTSDSPPLLSTLSTHPCQVFVDGGYATGKKRNPEKKNKKTHTPQFPSVRTCWSPHVCS